MIPYLEAISHLIVSGGFHVESRREGERQAELDMRSEFERRFREHLRTEARRRQVEDLFDRGIIPPTKIQKEARQVEREFNARFGRTVIPIDPPKREADPVTWGRNLGLLLLVGYAVWELVVR